MKILSMMLVIGMFVQGAMANEMRTKAEKLEQDGNWKEAYELRVKLLREVDDEKSGDDLRRMLENQNRLGTHGEFDTLMDEVVALKGENADFMKAAGDVYLSAIYYGTVLDGAFRRGEYGGNWIEVSEQNRVRALQCYMGAWGKVERGGQKEVALLQAIASALQRHRDGDLLWKFHLLTDLTQKVDFKDRIDRISSAGAPQGEDGLPIYLDVPESWDAAKSDGERWRWLLIEIARIDGAKKVDMEFQWWSFCSTIYGVETLASYSWWSQPDVAERDGMLQAETLREDETIAKLAGGVKRFELREDHRFIAGFRKLMSEEGGKSLGAGNALADVFLNRGQFVKAAEVLEEVIRLHGLKGDYPTVKKLNQIRGNWSQFQNTPTYDARKDVEVAMTYRNAKAVKLSLQRVDESLLLKDIAEYLKSNPLNLSYERINFSQLGENLLEKRGTKYVGEELKAWTEELKPREGHRDTEVNLKLGKLDQGCYLLRSEMEGGNTSWIVVRVRDLVVMNRNEGGVEAFYLVDSESGAPVQGELDFLGYETKYLNKAKGKRQYDVVVHQFRRKTDEMGRVELKDQKNFRGAQWYVVGESGERRAYYSDIYLRWDSYDRDDRWINRNTYVITDRPVYRPGQKVHMKLWAGEARYDVGDEFLFAKKSLKVWVSDGRGQKVFEKEGMLTDEYGGVDFDFELGEDAGLGAYQVRVGGEVPHGYGTFRVEEYKKPEFEVLVEGPKQAVTLGEVFEVEVIGKYYHGAPVTEGMVKIKVERDFYEERWFPYGKWDWLYGKGYWWFYGEYPWYPGWARWGCARPLPPWWWERGRRGAPEVVLERTMPIGTDGKVKVKIDSGLAKMVHGDQDHQYSITAEVVDASRRTIVGKGSVLAAREPYDVTVWLDRGYARVGEKVRGSFSARTPDGKEVKGTAVAVLYSSSLDEEGGIVEKEVGRWDVSGEGWEFVAKEAGQYRVAVLFADEKGRKREGATIFSVRGVNGEAGGDFRYRGIELIPDKKEYAAGDVVKLLVNVEKADARVWLYVRSGNHRVNEKRLFKMEGKSRVIEIPVVLGDMPNFFVDGVTVADGVVHETTREIVLPPEKRSLGVEVLPEKSKLKPREKTAMKVRVVDSEGKPFQGTAVVTVYDKSLEYISGGTNVGEIVPFYWSWKRNFYRLPMGNSQNLMGWPFQRKNTEYMWPLGMSENFGYGGFGFRGARGYAAGGVLPSMRSKGLMLEAAADASGMKLDREMNGRDIESKKAASGKNGGGDVAEGEVMVRSEFADLLKWVGKVETDEKGEAVIEMEMPDNLTTWKVRTWVMGKGTRVGEGSAEFVTSKDLIVRLQAPRFFVEKDEVVLSAVVHNYHEAAKDVKVSLEIDGSGVEAMDGGEKRVVISAGGESRVDWKVKAVREGMVKIRMKALTEGDGDAMEMDFPVYVHGMMKMDAYSRAIDADDKTGEIVFRIPEERRAAETRVTINYSPSLATAMVEALPYLVDYPYGCTEQTLNRFVPTVVVRRLLQDLGYNLADIRDKRSNLNAQILGNEKERAGQVWSRDAVWDDREVAKMERVGIKRLRDHQNPDGGWGWFGGGESYSYPHTTAVVMHGLLLAKANGSKVPDDMIASGLAWLEKYEQREVSRLASWEKKDTKKDKKEKADAMDAFVRMVLGEGGKSGEQMLGYLFRDKNDLPVYAKALLGLELARVDDVTKRDEVVRNIRQFLVKDDENQTAYLDLRNGSYWWWWYGSDYEAQAWFLKLLAVVEPKGEDARGLAKYLVNNRKNGYYWRSTRDTAYCLEALGAFIKASGESAPDMELDVLMDGKVLKTVKITKENLFSYESRVVVAGDVVTGGQHKVELRKRGTGVIYANAYVEYFTLEDFIPKAGLEVKVDRAFYKLVPDDKMIDAADSKGQVIQQKRAKLKRVPLKSGDEVKSGDLIEVELSIESKNDYEYLVFEDWKAAGMEAAEVQSGYNRNGLGAYMELRDEKVALFVRFLPQGKHNLSYRLRAEIPGKFSALPTVAEAMYAPELKANSDEMKVVIGE